MVGGLTLTLDVVETAAYFLAPALLWLFVYLLAHGDAERARAAGFDRLTFWVLIPGAFVGEFANLLVFGTGRDLLAVNIGGGLIPAFLAVWLLGRLVAAPRRSLAILFGALAAGTAVALVGQLWPVAPNVAGALVVGGLLGPAVLALAFFLGAPELSGTDGRWIAAGLAVFGATGLATFATTATVPGTGIVSTFPAYLLVPTALGAGTAFLGRRVGGFTSAAVLSLAYAGVTLGELVGADVLHQPPLYTSGGSALYAIGGAGLLDLLHLSGLLALAGAMAVVVLLERPTPAPGLQAPSAAGALRRINRAWYLGLEGRYTDSVREADAASRAAIGSLRLVAGLPPPEPETPWAGLPVAPWVPIDQANLHSLATGGDRISGREAYRSWLTARALIAVALAAAGRFRPRPMRRALAFALDLGLLTLLMFGVDLAVLGSIPGALNPVLNGIALDALVVGGVGWGLAYFLIFEAITGTTPGKRFYDLAVQARTGGPADVRSIWIRNLPRIIPLTLLAYVLGFAVAVLTHPLNAGLALGGFGGVDAFLRDLGGVAIVGFGLTALVGLLVIGATEEGQRLGDVLAETWVVTVPPVPAPRPTRRSVVVVRAVAGASPPGAG